MRKGLMKRILVLMALVVPTAWLAAAPAAADAIHHQAGPHHSDPDLIEPMPPSWQKKPILYDSLPPGTDLAITLDQQLYPALRPLIKEFADGRGLKVALQEGTCGISSGALIDKKVDMGGFCCPASQGDRLPGLTFHTLGIGALALLKNRANPTEGLSRLEAMRIYHGEIASWDELEGRAAPLPSLGPIDATVRLHCKDRPGHWRLILDNENLFSPTVSEVSTIQDMIGRVADAPAALGYETLWMVERFGGGRVEVLKVDGISPYDEEALIAGRYPFYRTFNITSWSDPALAREEVTALVAYLKANFHRVAKEYYIIPAERLRGAGWRFVGDELMSPPEQD